MFKNPKDYTRKEHSLVDPIPVAPDPTSMARSLGQIEGYVASIHGRLDRLENSLPHFVTWRAFGIIMTLMLIVTGGLAAAAFGR